MLKFALRLFALYWLRYSVRKLNDTTEFHILQRRPITLIVLYTFYQCLFSGFFSAVENILRSIASAMAAYPASLG
jgi:hypothetical protein